MTNDDRAQAFQILIADDDPAIRGLFSAALRNAGYDVELAADGDEALDALHRRCPDLLLADLVMPGLTGDRLARRLRERCPDAALVFMSGYSEEHLHEMDIKQVVFLPKPIAPRDLVQFVTRILTGANGEPQPR